MAELIPQSPSILEYGTILNQWDAMKEDINTTLWYPYGDEYGRVISSFLMAFGQKQEIHQPEYSWFERDRLVVSMTVDNGPVSRASGVYTVQIPAGEVSAQGYSWPNAQDVWEHAPTGAQFYIESRSSDSTTFVMKPVVSTTNIQMQDGDKLFYIKQTSKENSDGPAPKYSFSTKKTVEVDIQRHSKYCSGSALYNQLWYTQTQSGVATPYSDSLDIQELQHLHSVSMVNSFLAGQLTPNLDTDESFGSFIGLNAAIAADGQNEDTDGSPDESDFYSLENKLSQQDGNVRNYNVLMPGYVFQKISQSMRNYFNDTGIVMADQELRSAMFAQNLDTRAMRATLDFQTLVVNGKNFGFSRLGFLDNPEIFNTGTQSTNLWQNRAWFIPIGTNANDGNGNLGKYVRLVHKPGRFMKMWETGAMAPSNKTRQDNLAVDILSEYAFAFININQFGRFFD